MRVNAGAEGGGNVRAQNWLEYSEARERLNPAAKRV